LKEIVRMRFKKTGRAKYISHLDLIRCLQRAVCRAKLPAAYSEGFHPHMQTSFATTLPLGFTGTGELMDLELSEPLPCETVMERLNAVLPEGIRILEAGKGQLAFKKLAYARYTVRIPCEDAAVLHRSFDSFCAQPEIITEKRTKKGGTKEVDLKPMLEVTAVTEQPDALEVELCLPAGSIANLNPMLLLDAWKKQSGAALSAPEISRTELLTEEKQKFF
jgi:radical SAM-linked protein